MYRYHHVKVLHVLDGDTIRVEVDLGFRLSRVDNMRLYGCDAYELKEPNGNKAKEFVENLILNAKEIILETHKSGEDKYGRYLAKMFVDGRDLSHLLIEADLAKPFMVDR